MLVKIFKRRHNGSPKASIDYLLGKERNREVATILRGNPELSLHLAETLLFKNKYTVGCLSFEENDINEENKQALMDSFEAMIFAGLSGEQYNISWIEHKDKGRLELNFFIPNVELSTQKRLQPYYHKTDKVLVDSWIRIQNDHYQLSDPHHPAKQQLNQILFDKDTKYTEIKKQIGDAIQRGIIDSSITNRKEVIALLTNVGFTIERTTDKSISISHPELNKNIRLTGVIYEDRVFDECFAATFNHEATAYQSDTGNRIRLAQTRFNEAFKRRTEFNQSTYRANHQATIQTHYSRDSTWDIDNHFTHSLSIKSLSLQSNQRTLHGLSKSPTTNRQTGTERTNASENSRRRECHTINHSRNSRKDISKSEWSLSIGNLQKIGEYYVKRIQHYAKQFTDSVRKGYANITNAKYSINQANINIKRTEQRIESTKRAIEQAKSITKLATQQITLIKNRNELTH